MCSKVTCNICHKATWSGCGEHVEQALAGVPQSERCQGHSAEQSAAATSDGIFKRLFGR